MKSKKVILLDAETLPNIGLFWSCGRKINMAPDQILEERRLCVISYKYLGDPHVYTLRSCADDKQLLAEFVKIANKVEAVIAHNGDRFDIPWFRARLMFHGLEPLQNILSIDTLKLSRNSFQLNSHRLDYLGDFLKVGRKKDGGGWDRVKKILKGDEKALLTHAEYCEQDVLLLEEVFLKMVPYVKRLPFNLGFILQGSKQVCPKCGSHNLSKNGIDRRGATLKQKFYCNDHKGEAGKAVIKRDGSLGEIK